MGVLSFVATPYVLAQTVSATISLCAAVVAWRRKEDPAGLVFALLMTCVAIWTAFTAMEEAAVGIAAKLLLSKVSYVGSVNVAPLFFLFAWRSRRGGARLPVPAALIWIIPAGALALAATNELHHFLWRAVTLPGGADNLAVYAHGPAWWVLVGYDFIMVVAASLFIAQTAIALPRARARQSAMLIAAVVVVWIGLGLYVAPGNPVPGFDLPALSCALAGVIILLMRDSRDRLRVEETARESARNMDALLAAARRQAKELALIDEVRTSLAREMDLRDIYRTVVEGIARAFGYTQVSLYVVEDGLLVLQHQVGYSHVLESIPITRGIMARVVRRRQAELVPDVRADPDFLGAMEGLVSEVCVPIVDQGTPVGVLNVESTNGVVMGSEDFRLMSVMGEHVGIAFSRARLYAEARSNEERYRALVSTLGEGVAVVDLSERFSFANPAAEAIFGVAGGTLAGRSLAEFLSPEELARAIQETERRRRGEANTYELSVTRPDGEMRRLELIATPRRAESGEVIGTTGVFRDVTEITRLQERLADERALLLTLIDNLPDYIYLKDRESRFILANRAQALLVGARDAKELVGKTDHDYIPRELADSYRQGDLEVIRSREPTVNVEETSQGADGLPLKVLTTKVPLFGAAGEVTGIVGISRDVTDFRRAEEERARLQEQLQQSQKMEAVGRLAGGIAHDFNNILTVILGYCEVSQEEAQGNPVLERNLKEIKRAAQRSAKLTAQLLAFSRRQVLQPRLFDLGDLVEGMGGMLRALLGEDIRLDVRRAAPSLRVVADPGRVEQVIMNLAVNARDAMPQGGVLSLETGAARLGPEDLPGDTDAAPGEFVTLTVGDTGHGMDAATQERLFEPFFTTKEIGKGTGLGLATVYGIVRQSRGHITCRSKLGEGTVFCLYLPRSAES